MGAPLPTHPPPPLQALTDSKPAKSEAFPKMLRLRVLLLLAALTTAAHSLKCWQTGDSVSDMTPLPLPKATSLRSAAVPIVEVTCANSGDTCMRKWWTVAKVSDVYYSLGCSSNAVKSEEETSKGAGKQGLSYCSTDYCNSSNMVSSPFIGLLLAALVSVLVH